MLTGDALLEKVKELCHTEPTKPVSREQSIARTQRGMTEELVSLTKPNLIQKEGLVQKNQRIEIIIDTLAYLVMKKVDLDEMKVLMRELNNIIENS
jgi:hypothetical protein